MDDNKWKEIKREYEYNATGERVLKSVIEEKEVKQGGGFNKKDWIDLFF